jgi:hypothetical protein
MAEVQQVPLELPGVLKNTVDASSQLGKVQRNAPDTAGPAAPTAFVIH